VRGRGLVTDDLRARLRADLNAERPPPLGDVVRAALRDGRRIRRRRRWSAAGAGLAIAAAATLTAGADRLTDRPVAGPPAAATPGYVPFAATGPATPVPVRTLTVPSGVQRAAGPPAKATPPAMLFLLTQLLPPGPTSRYAVAPGAALHVGLDLDRGSGPAPLRVMMGDDGPGGAARGGTATVTVLHAPDDCTRDTVVGARWPDGTDVRVEVAACGHPPALSVDEAIRLAADPRWGLSMDVDLVKQGTARFGELPVRVR
jgi:hypothetical protein